MPQLDEGGSVVANRAVLERYFTLDDDLRSAPWHEARSEPRVSSEPERGWRARGVVVSPPTKRYVTLYLAAKMVRRCCRGGL